MRFIALSSIVDTAVCLNATRESGWPTGISSAVALALAMVLTMRPAGLSSGIDHDRADYTAFCGKWNTRFRTIQVWARTCRLPCGRLTSAVCYGVWGGWEKARCWIRGDGDSRPPRSASRRRLIVGLSFRIYRDQSQKPLTG
jgi:hypothetical protein